MLRTASTYTAARRLTNQLLDRRPMPISVPSTVAAAIPATEIRSVFKKPW